MRIIHSSGRQIRKTIPASLRCRAPTNGIYGEPHRQKEDSLVPSPKQARRNTSTPPGIKHDLEKNVPEIPRRRSYPKWRARCLVLVGRKMDHKIAKRGARTMTRKKGRPGRPAVYPRRRHEVHVRVRSKRDVSEKDKTARGE
jgi:hypothetical protein